MFWLCATLLSVLLAGAFWATPIVPTHDGPNHVLAAWWWNHLDTPGQLWSERITPVVPLTGVAFLAPFWLIEPLVGWAAATRLVLAASGLAFAWGTIALGRAAHARVHWPTLLVFPAWFAWSLYMGFFNFVVAMAFVPWLLAWAIRREHFGRIEAFVLAPALVLLAWAHLVAALLAGFALGIVALTHPRRLGSLLWLGLASIGVFVLQWLSMQRGVEEGIPSIAYILGDESRWLRLDLFARSIVSGPRWRAELLVGIVLIGAIAGLVRPGRVRALALIATAAFAAAFFAPFNLDGLVGFAPRFGFVAMAAGVAAMPWPERASTTRGAAALIVAAAMALTGWAWAFHARLGEHYAAQLEGIGAPAPTNGYRVFIGFDETFDGEATRAADVPMARFSSNTTDLHVIMQGGFTRVFSQMGQGSVKVAVPLDRELPTFLTAEPLEYGRLARRRGDPAMPDQERTRLAELEHRWLVAAAAYDDAILYGDRTARDPILARGFETTFDGPRVSLARYVGCTVTFGFETPVANATRAVATTGIGRETVLVFRRGVSAQLDVGGRGARLSGVPCGEDVVVQLEVFAASDAGERSVGTCVLRGQPIGDETFAPCAGAP